MKRTLPIAAALVGTVALAVAAQMPDPAGGKMDTQPDLSAPATAVSARRATRIKIEVFENGAPAATVSIPLWLARGASRLMPKQMEGVSIDEVLKLAENPPANGILLEVEDHRDKSRVVISVGD